MALTLMAAASLLSHGGSEHHIVGPVHKAMWTCHNHPCSRGGDRLQDLSVRSSRHAFHLSSPLSCNS
jgi:hypothetical protein